MKSYYDSALSGVTTLLDHRIKAAQKSKDAAIKALEQEKEAALSGYQAQLDSIDAIIKEKNKAIKALEKEKKALEKQKKPLQDEIDAIQKANEERDRQLQLQKDLYELERLQNQRTQFIYKDGQMVYQTDPDAIRDARTQVQKDEDDARIAELEKQIEAIEKQQELLDEQIEYLNEEIDLLEEQKSEIQEIMDSIEKYYDDLIAQTEEYWDSIIEALEETKSKYEELAEIEKLSEAFGKVQEVFGDLGYTVEDVLSGNEAAFNDFKDKYIQVLAGLHSGDENYLAGLSQVTGKSVEELQKVADKMMDVGDTVTEPMEETGKAVKDVGDKAQAASTGVGTFATKAGEAAEKSGELKSNLEGVPEGLDSISNIDGTKLDPLVANLQSIATLLGGEDGTGGLIASISELTSNPELLTPLIDQFNLLTEAIGSAVTALGGGGGGESGGGPDFVGNTNAQVSAMQNAGGEEGGGSGLTGAIEAVKTAADQYIGADVDAEGGTAIGDFNALAESVDGVTSVIGSGGGGGNLTDKGYPDSKGESKTQSGLSGDGTLIGALQDVGTVSNEQIGGIATDRMNTFKESVEQAKLQVEGIVKGLDDIAKHEDVECTIKINIEVSGGLPTLSFGAFKATGTAMPWDGMNLESATYVAKYATGTAYPHFGGSAYVKGDWGVQKGGKSLVGELGQEIIIRGGRFFTVGDNGPEFVNLEPNDIVLNHLQTRELLDKKNLIKPIGASGRAYADGTLPSNFTPLSQANPEAFNTLVQNAELLRTNTEDMKTDLADIGYATDDIRQAVQNITNNTNMGTTITFGDLQFTCNGITSAEVLNEVGNALQREFQGITLNAYQRAVNMA